MRTNELSTNASIDRKIEGSIELREHGLDHQRLLVRIEV